MGWGGKRYCTSDMQSSREEKWTHKGTTPYREYVRTLQKDSVGIRPIKKHVEERMGDHWEELLVRSRGIYLLIYSADRNRCSARISMNWKLAPFKFQTTPLASWMSDRRKKSITAERRTQSLTRVAWHPQRQKSSYVPLAVRGKNILRVRSVRTSRWPAEIGGRYLATIVNRCSPRILRRGI